MGQILGGIAGGGGEFQPPSSFPDAVEVPGWASTLKSKNPKVFFDIGVEGEKEIIGRVEMLLAKEVVPKTVENFQVSIPSFPNLYPN
jgi:hypothetical protein